MLLAGPVTVFFLAFFWVAILLHTQLPRHHYGTQGLQPRLHRRVVRRVVGPVREPKHGLRLVVRMSPQPLYQTSEAAVDRSTQGRTKATAVRVRLHHLCAKPGNIPAKPGRPTRHCSVLVRTISHQSSQYPRPLSGHTQQPPATRRGTPPDPRHFLHQPVNSNPLAPPPPPPTTTCSGRKDRRSRLYRHLGLARSDWNLIGMPQTTRVGHTFPLVMLGFQMVRINPVWTWKKRVYFFYPPPIPQGILTWPRVRVPRGPRPSSIPSPGVRVTVSAVETSKGGFFSAHAPSWIFGVTTRMSVSVRLHIKGP